ncbi:NAD(P)/FAD-dependent oxidoreductase [Archangium sp.]|uniref:NAD(P)/FAD-dependent oxidoreductase n=1 Tax=Archangium sp. TaxID=1872627 RepID=UPI002EDA71D2
MRAWDVAVVGGGPAGLAVALTVAKRGLSAVVLERASVPPDKACGEGLMPSGVAALERFGALALLEPRECAPFVGIRYVQEDGSGAEGRLPAPGGLGVRRVALVTAMATRARTLGVELRERCAVVGQRRTADGWQLETATGPLRARMLVAADGLASPLRHAEGLEVEVSGPRRFGLRRHFRLKPWAPFVEVHLSDGVEAYVTPAGEERVGVAFLWADGLPGRIGFDSLLSRFPVLAARVAGAEPDSKARGAGPLARAARSRVADRFALVGDAAGYVDAVTGEGLSLAFTCAEALGHLLPDALAKGATRESLLPYERTFQRAFRKYAWLTHGLLMLARRPRVRRSLVRWLGEKPRVFEQLLAHAIV